MIEVEIRLTRKVIGEQRIFSSLVFVDENETLEGLHKTIFDIVKYLSEKGDILKDIEN